MRNGESVQRLTPLLVIGHHAPKAFPKPRTVVGMVKMGKLVADHVIDQ